MEYYGQDLIPSATGRSNDLRMHFTKENAKYYSQMANHARWHGVKPETVPNEQSGIGNGIPDRDTNDFAAKRLIRIRTQLDRLDSMIAEAEDSKTLKELADATTRLAEQERQLSGRPLPGTLRPDKPKSKPAQLPPAPDTQ